MVSNFKTSLLACLFFGGMACADTTQNTADYKSGAEAGEAFVSQLVESAKKDSTVSCPDYLFLYFPTDDPSSFNQGVIAGLGKNDILKLVTAAGLDEKNKAGVLCTYYHLRDLLIAEVGVHEKVATVLYKVASPEKIELVKSFDNQFGKKNQGFNLSSVLMSTAVIAVPLCFAFCLGRLSSSRS